MSKNPGSKPFIENYPPLYAWLCDHGARCDWQRYEERMSVEQWSIGDRSFVLVIHADGHGWDIYTPTATDKIDEVLRDAETRLGLSPTVGLHVRISQADRRRLRQAAAISGRSVGEIVREAVFAEAQRVLRAGRVE